MCENIHWKEENPSIWDEDKEKISSDCRNAFALDKIVLGTKLSDKWWKLSTNNKTIGYGWISINRDYAEISIMVKEDERDNKYGEMILGKLEMEAKVLGYSTIRGIVKPGNDSAQYILKLLYKCGFSPLHIKHGNWTVKEIMKDMPHFKRFGFDCTFSKDLK